MFSPTTPHPSRRGFVAPAILAMGVALALGCGDAAKAQTDEIQVYNAQIAEPGVVNLTLHDN
jgi:hypothetical protein